MKHGPSSQSFAKTNAGSANSNQATAYVPDKTFGASTGNHPGAPDRSQPGRGSIKGDKPQLNSNLTSGAGMAS